MLFAGAGTHQAHSYKPVILMHGVSASAHEMDLIHKLINETHPGTIVTNLAVFEGNPSSWSHNLAFQVDGVMAKIRKVINRNPQLYEGGYHFVCKSQGALICRCIVEAMDDHRVHTFVSLAGPQLGVFGDGYFQFLKRIGLPEWFIQDTADEMWRVAYSWLGQKFSVGNMWHDYHHFREYFKYDLFLPNYTDFATPTMRSNFMRLQKAVFCVGSGSPFDGGIEPWQTGAWGFWDGNGSMLNITEHPFYVNDTFGLRSLDESGRLELTVVPGVKHADWTGNESIIRKFVLPHCT